MELRSTPIPNCYEIKLVPRQDRRGLFLKTFRVDFFEKYNLATNYQEEYYSISHQRVLRGLHFQKPPHDHVKLVYCVAGEIMDAVVDLRKGSPTFGQFQTFRLSAEKANMVYIPKGLAHGFYVLSESAIVMYKVTTTYAPGFDAGLLWNSVGIPWPNSDPILSERDRSFVPLSEFTSPFSFQVS